MPPGREGGSVQIRFGGYGGQGIVLAGTLLGKAATIYDGKEAVFTQAYGPEARGGASRADIIIAAVGFPNAVTGDMIKEGAVVIDVGALLDGYHSDMTRTFIVGQPSEEQERW